MFRSSKLILLLLTTLFTASCAELNTALENANQALGSLNGSVSGSSGQSNRSKTLPIASKNTAQYGTRNMQLWVDDSATCPSKNRLKLTGSVYNKTNKDMYVSFEMPTYNTRHERGGAFAYRLLVSPKEWTEVTSNYQDCIDQFDVNRMTTQSYHP